jgi:hypothetical protein
MDATTVMRAFTKPFSRPEESFHWKLIIFFITDKLIQIDLTTEMLAPEEVNHPSAGAKEVEKGNH